MKGGMKGNGVVIERFLDFGVLPGNPGREYNEGNKELVVLLD